MKDIVGSILNKYGAFAFFLAIIFAAAVWLLAHFAAAPGAEVSVLWGFVKYTKPPVTQLYSQDKPVPPSSSTTTQPTPPMSPPIEKAVSSESTGNKNTHTTTINPVTLTVCYNVDQSNFEKSILDLRVKRKLRELSVAESGKRVDQIPRGTFFFVTCLFLQSNANFIEGQEVHDFFSPFQRARVSRIRRSSLPDIEVQYLESGDYHLIIFLSEQSASQVSKLNGETRHEVMAAYYPWESMTSLVSLPIDRIFMSSYRELQISNTKKMSILDIVIN